MNGPVNNNYLKLFENIRPIDVLLFILCVFLAHASSSNLFGFSRDYFEYKYYYDTISGDFYVTDTRFEPGFHVISWIFKNWLGANMSALVFFLVLTSLGIKFVLFRKYLNQPLFALLLYLIIFFPIHEYTQYRVGVSLAFGYWAVHKILEKKYLLAAALFIASLSFHYSSILLPLITLAITFTGWRLSLISIFVIGVIGPAFLNATGIISVDLLQTLNPLSSSYLENKAMIDDVSILSINNILLIFSIIGYLIAKIYNRSKYHQVFLIIAILCFIPIILMPNSPIIAQRSKEVLFVGVIFLSCRSKFLRKDLMGSIFLLLTGILLLYLNIDGGVIFS